MYISVLYLGCPPEKARNSCKDAVMITFCQWGSTDFHGHRKWFLLCTGRVQHHSLFYLHIINLNYSLYEQVRHCTLKLVVVETSLKLTWLIHSTDSINKGKLRIFHMLLTIKDGPS